MYMGDRPVVHLVGEAQARRPADLTLEHFAFRAEGLAAFQETLTAHGVTMQLTEVTDAGIVQVNIHDPDGNHIHVDFSLSETG